MAVRMIKSRNKKRALFLAFLVVIVLLGAIAIIKVAQGYRPDLDNLDFRPTGLLVATSEPDGAQLFVDGELISATNTTVNLNPGQYEVEIKKDGYFAWKKTLPIEKELVMKAEAHLFPTFPDLSSLTFTGAANPVISPDGLKVTFAVTNASGKKNGLWILDLGDRPLGFSREPRQIVASAARGRDFGNAAYVWSPDSKQLLVNLKNRPGPAGRQIEENFLLDTGQLNPDTSLIDVSQQLTLIYNTWQEEISLREKDQAKKLPEKLLAALEGKTKNLMFSPDETKILYTATASATLPDQIIPPLPAANPMPETRQLESGGVYTYDLKEDRNFYIIDQPESEIETKEEEAAKETSVSEPIVFEDFLELSSPLPRQLSWFPTSRHLFYTQEGKITILEYDNTNWVDVYTGQFENSFAFPFPSGNRILVLTSLGSDQPPNLYAISLH
jgi:hypothetical protein